MTFLMIISGSNIIIHSFVFLMIISICASNNRILFFIVPIAFSNSLSILLITSIFEAIYQQVGLLDYWYTHGFIYCNSCMYKIMGNWIAKYQFHIHHILLNFIIYIATELHNKKWSLKRLRINASSGPSF